MRVVYRDRQAHEGAKWKLTRRSVGVLTFAQKERGNVDVGPTSSFHRPAGEGDLAPVTL